MPKTRCIIETMAWAYWDQMAHGTSPPEWVTNLHFQCTLKLGAEYLQRLDAYVAGLKQQLRPTPAILDDPEREAVCDEKPQARDPPARRRRKRKRPRSASGGDPPKQTSHHRGQRGREHSQHRHHHGNSKEHQRHRGGLGASMEPHRGEHLNRSSSSHVVIGAPPNGICKDDQAPKPPPLVHVAQAKGRSRSPYSYTWTYSPSPHR